MYKHHLNSHNNELQNNKTIFFSASFKLGIFPQQTFLDSWNFFAYIVYRHVTHVFTSASCVTKHNKFLYMFSE